MSKEFVSVLRARNEATVRLCEKCGMPATRFHWKSTPILNKETRKYVRDENGKVQTVITKEFLCVECAKTLVPKLGLKCEKCNRFITNDKYLLAWHDKGCTGE